MESGDDVPSDAEEDWSEPLLPISLEQDYSSIPERMIDVNGSPLSPQSSQAVMPQPNRQQGSCSVRQSISDDHPRTIVHIDIDCFYAQVEMIRNPSLKVKPLGVQQKYLLVTCNYKARELGVTKMMSIKQAKEKCPQLVLVNGEDLTHYRHMSYKITDLLRTFAPAVERLGFDENFIDVSHIVLERLKSANCERQLSGHLYGADEAGQIDETYPNCLCGCHSRLLIGSQVAMELRQALWEELGITGCAGIAHNKLLSKLVAGAHKPNQQTTLFPDRGMELLSTLKSVKQIPGIGHSMSNRLSALNIVSIADLQACSEDTLTEEFGTPLSNTMKQLCFGIDESPVITKGLPQSLSDEDSFRKCSTEKEAQDTISKLLNSLLVRVLEDGRIPQTVRLTIRRLTAVNKWTSRESRQTPIAGHLLSNLTSDNADQICSKMTVVIMGLFRRLVNTSEPFHLTLINVCFTKLNSPIKSTINSFFSASCPANPTATDNQLNRSSTESSSGFNCSSLCTIKRLDEESESILSSATQTGIQSNMQQDGLKTEKHVSASQGISRSSKGKQLTSGIDVWLERSSIAGRSHSHQTVSPPEDNLFGASLSSHKRRHSESDSQSPSNEGKKSKLSNDNNCSNLVCMRDMSAVDIDIPEHIDVDTFHELPAAIQQELLQVYRTNKSKHNMPASVMKSDSQTQLPGNTTTKESCSRLTLATEGGNKSSYDNSFTFANQNSSDNAAMPASKNSGENAAMPVGKNSGDNVAMPSGKNSGDNVAMPSGKNSGDNVAMPSGIDMEVFSLLPADIQKEISSQWAGTPAKQSSKPLKKPPSGIELYFNKPLK